jgi:hypothetical protein
LPNVSQSVQLVHIASRYLRTGTGERLGTRG